MGWFLAVVFVIVLLLACPVVLYVRYDEKLVIRGRYLFFTYSLTNEKDKSIKQEVKKAEKPSKKKTAANKPADKPKEKKSSFAQIKDEQGISGFLSFLTDMATVAVGSLAKLFKHCKLSRYRIFVKVAGDDPAATAKLYGEVCAVLMPLSSFFIGRFRHERNASVRVDPDFLSDVTTIYADIRCRISLFFIVREAISAVIKIILVRSKNISQSQNKNTGGVEHGRTCN